ncbi:MAG: FAD binding domain-containing protein [Bdellovibrionales bacterium]|nr:FAD binding domain-containing protein [Bdellovibrionales bacterium]
MARDTISFYLNGKLERVSGPYAMGPLSDYLRYKKQQTGTKVVCAEGDCGACTVMIDRSVQKSSQEVSFHSINSCIAMVALLDGCHVVTVEGLETNGELHPVQESIVKNFGAQCGFCTPGFVMALTDLHEQKDHLKERHVKNFLTGNLCRCTGYSPIINAGLGVDKNNYVKLKDRYTEHQGYHSFKNEIRNPIHLKFNEFETEYEFVAPQNLKDAVDYISKNPTVRIISGSTDLGVQINKRKTKVHKAMSLQNIPEMYELRVSDGKIIVGARVTLSELQSVLEDNLPAFGRFLNIFASPQIKNKATLVGNIANASPIADTTPVLMALDSVLQIVGKSGSRVVALKDFYLGYKKLDLKDGEFIASVEIPIPANAIVDAFKISQRRDLDISCVNLAVVADINGRKLEKIAMSAGGVAATTIRLEVLEKKWQGQSLDYIKDDISKLDFSKFVSPLSDVRGTAEFRTRALKNLISKFFAQMSET